VEFAVIMAGLLMTETSMRIPGGIRRDHGWSAGDGNDYAG
jgi:hypothetical protein